MDYNKKDTESVDEWLERISVAAERSVKNMEQIKSDMKRDGVIGFCSECSCNIYKKKKHICEI